VVPLVPRELIARLGAGEQLQGAIRDVMTRTADQVPSVVTPSKQASVQQWIQTRCPSVLHH
jgi:hypothetical protein